MGFGIDPHISFTNHLKEVSTWEEVTKDQKKARFGEGHQVIAG